MSVASGWGEMPTLPMQRFTVQQYHRMIETGILNEDNRVELLEGWIVHKMPHNPLHDATITFVKDELEDVLPEPWFVRIQCAITTTDSEPEPDIAVVKGPSMRYLRSHPRRRDIAVAIEVSDSTLLSDRNTKARVYARARIPVYWIANLVDRAIEIYTEPRGGKGPAYLQRRDYGIDERVPVILNSRRVGYVAVRDLLP